MTWRGNLPPGRPLLGRVAAGGTLEPGRRAECGGRATAPALWSASGTNDRSVDASHRGPGAVERVLGERIPSRKVLVDVNAEAGLVIRPQRAIADLHEKAYEAIRLLSTPPANGQSLNADELRSLLGDRLDKILTLTNKVIAATKTRNDLETSPPQSIEDPTK